MDLNTVEEVRSPSSRDDLWPLADGDVILAGGTWLFSEPQPGLRRLVDVTALGWEPITLNDNGIEFAATCPVADVADLADALPGVRPQWTAAPLLGDCCAALLASKKILRIATVGGNICLAFPAGAMISLASALDGVAVIWRACGGIDTVPVVEFVTGAARNVLAHGDVLRAIRLPAPALRSRTAFRKLAPSPLGRSAAVVIGRRDRDDDGGRFVLSVTAATERPVVLEFDTVPSAAAIDAAHAEIPDAAWTSDAHGDPAWRRAVTRVLAQQVRGELT